VEDSSLGVKRTLRELDINRSTFMSGIGDIGGGLEGLAVKRSQERRFWKAIPPWVKSGG